MFSFSFGVLHVLTFCSLNVIIAEECKHARRVYIDMGASWGNTMKLFKMLDGNFDFANYGGWEIYSFEASPLIQPYLEDYAKWLNGEKEEEPETCLPRSGSPHTLGLYAEEFHCSKKTFEKQRECLSKRLHRPLMDLKADPRLNETSFLENRLNSAIKCPDEHRTEPRYIPVPAACSAEDGWLDIGYANRMQLIHGGVLPKLDQPVFHWDSKVRKVDVVNWMKKSFTKADFVFLKMDIEGEEHHVVKRMIDEDVFSLIDLFSFDCHGIGGVNFETKNGPFFKHDCEELRHKIKKNYPFLKSIGVIDMDTEVIPTSESIKKMIEKCKHRYDIK